MEMARVNIERLLAGKTGRGMSPIEDVRRERRAAPDLQGRPTDEQENRERGSATFVERRA